MGRHLVSSLASVLGYDVRCVDGKAFVWVDCYTKQPGICLQHKQNHGFKTDVIWYVVAFRCLVLV